MEVGASLLVYETRSLPRALACSWTERISLSSTLEETWDTYKASSRSRSLSGSVIPNGSSYVTVRVSVHGRLGSNWIDSRIRCRAFCEKRTLAI
jgi:hypothetical protein